MAASMNIVAQLRCGDAAALARHASSLTQRAGRRLMPQPRASRVEDLVEPFVSTQADQLAIVMRELKVIADIDAALTEVAVINPQDRLALRDEAHDVHARAEARFVETINGRLGLGAERTVAFEKKCGDQFIFIAGIVVRREPHWPFASEK